MNCYRWECCSFRRGKPRWACRPMEALEHAAKSDELFANLALIDNARTPCRMLEKPAASGRALYP